MPQTSCVCSCANAWNGQLPRNTCAPCVRGSKPCTSVVTRGDVEAQTFHAFWLAGNRVVAGMHVNCWEEGIAPVQELIRARQPVDADRLADISVSIGALPTD